MVFSITKNEVSEDEKGGVWRQLFLSFLASLCFFTHGVETISLSSSAHSGTFKTSTLEDQHRAAAMIVGAAVSAPVYSYVIDKYGRKAGIFVVSLIQGASCIPLFLPPNLATLIVLHIIAGLSSGGLFTVLPAYLAEISNPEVRGVNLCLPFSMVTAGYLIKLALDDEGKMFLMVALIVIQLISLWVMAESPAYLVMVYRIQDAKQNIAKLKSLPEVSPTVSKELSRLVEERDAARDEGRLSIGGILRRPIYRDVFKIGIALYTVMILCGSVIFLDQEKALVQLKMTLDPEYTMIVSCLFGGSLLTLACTRFLERKHILTVGFVVMVLSMGVLAIYNQRDLTVTSLRLVPVISLGVLVFAYGVAWGLPVVVISECCNLEIRSKMLAMIYTYSQIIKLIYLYCHQYIENYLGLYTLLFIFCVINIYGALYALFVIPNIKNKSVQQIEKQMKRIPLLDFKHSK